jgi:hypothetical protein
MSELKNPSLAIGYCPAAPISAGDLGRFTRAAARLLPAVSAAFDPRHRSPPGQSIQRQPKNQSRQVSFLRLNFDADPGVAKHADQTTSQFPCASEAHVRDLRSRYGAPR